jgi:hypothetical protein
MKDLKELELKIQAVKKQVQESKKKTENPSGDPKFRQVRKRLRRLQRKHRALLAPKKPLAQKAEPAKPLKEEKAEGAKP